MKMGLFRWFKKKEKEIKEKEDAQLKRGDK